MTPTAAGIARPGTHDPAALPSAGERTRTAAQRTSRAPLVLSALVGVVAFPSYHAAIALVPVRVTLPAKGDHDLTNGLAGVAITALTCLWLAGRDRVAADTRRQ